MISKARAAGRGLVILLLWASGAAASPTQPVTWNVTALPTPARAGETVTLSLRATIDPGWHVYGAGPVEGPVPTALKLDATSWAKAAGPLLEPTPLRKHDEGFGVEVTYHPSGVELRQGIRLGDKLPASGATLTAELTFQACTATSCLPPEHLVVRVPLSFEKGPARPEFTRLPVAAAPPPPPPAGFALTSPAAAAGANAADAAGEARRRGLVSFLVVAFLAGLAALLTPCVFPMVPITVSFFTKQAGDNPGRRVSLALFYGLGIMVTYTGLGLLLAITMGATGVQRVATNPWVNLGFAGLFTFFAISLFGYFEIGLPSGLVNRSNKLGAAGGYLGAAFMGLTLTLAAFTCTVQFVGGILVWAANGELLWPVLGMLSFSLAFALPFVLLALFPQWLAALPKSGGWLHDTKVVLAFVELAAAFKFISNADLVWNWQVFSRELVLAIWAVCALGTAVYLFGRLSIAGTGIPPRVGWTRLNLGVLFVLLAGYFAWGLTGARLRADLESLLPPTDYGRGPRAVSATALEWLDDWDQGLAQAEAEGRLALLDFTGVTCTNCRWMEQNLFILPEIRERLAKFTLVKLYTDTGPRADEYRRRQESAYQTVSLPFYAVVTPDGETLATFDGMTRDAAAFQKFLDQALGSR